MIILEGPDGVGKSTLADAIESVHPNVFRVNNGPPPPDVPAYLHYSCMIDDLNEIRKSGKLVVVDRFHVGELVYAPMFRGQISLTLDEARLLDEELNESGAVLVHCWLTYQKMIQRQIQRDGGKPDEKSGAGMEHAAAIRRAFEWACGTPDRAGALSTHWVVSDMNYYPTQIASSILNVLDYKRNN